MCKLAGNVGCHINENGVSPQSVLNLRFLREWFASQREAMDHEIHQAKSLVQIPDQSVIILGLPLILTCNWNEQQQVYVNSASLWFVRWGISGFREPVFSCPCTFGFHNYVSMDRPTWISNNFVVSNCIVCTVIPRPVRKGIDTSARAFLLIANGKSRIFVNMESSLKVEKISK